MYYSEDDKDVSVDFQEQADAYEALLSSCARMPWIAGVYSFNYNYWDSLDKAPSVRAKPAESVLSKWFGWIDPESAPYPPSNLKGEAKLNRSLSQKEYVDVLSWDTNVNNANGQILKYRIYRLNDETLILLGDVNVETPTYSIRRAPVSSACTYAVAAVNVRGEEGEKAFVKVH